MARVGFPVPGVEGAIGRPPNCRSAARTPMPRSPWIKHSKTATPATMTDPATILPCALAVGAARAAKVRRTPAAAAPHANRSATVFEADSQANCVTQITDNAAQARTTPPRINC